jgi:hypothetical protein
VLPICGSSDRCANELRVAAEDQVQSRPLPQHLAQASQSQPSQSNIYLFFNTEVASFIEAAFARLIPKDDGGDLKHRCCYRFLRSQR